MNEEEKMGAGIKSLPVPPRLVPSDLALCEQTQDPLLCKLRSNKLRSNKIVFCWITRVALKMFHTLASIAD